MTVVYATRVTIEDTRKVFANVTVKYHLEN